MLPNRPPKPEQFENEAEAANSHDSKGCLTQRAAPVQAHRLARHELRIRYYRGSDVTPAIPGPHGGRRSPNAHIDGGAWRTTMR